MTRPVTLPRPDGRPTLAVWKFASCDGCQLSLLDCEDELLAIGESLRIASFPEASSAIVEGPYDLSLVEGSVTTPDDIDRIRAIRRKVARSAVARVRRRYDERHVEQWARDTQRALQMSESREEEDKKE